MKKKIAGLTAALMLSAPFLACASVDDLPPERLVEEGAGASADAEDAGRKEAAAYGPRSGFSAGGTVFLDYSSGVRNGDDTRFSSFQVTRGYLNLKYDAARWLRARITPDFTHADAGSGARLKYLFAEFLAPEYGALAGASAMAGLGITPFQDFEQSINIYRVQGQMFEERSNVDHISDTGVSFFGNLGGAIAQDWQEAAGLPSRYDGRYGSYHFGVYDGGGSGAAATNGHRAIEGRLTVRPLPDVVPGLQFTWSGIFGKAGHGDNPWTSSLGFVSLRTGHLVLTGQYLASVGEQSGRDEFHGRGFSLFGDLRMPFYDRVSAFLRYDRWNPGVTLSGITAPAPGTGFRRHTSIGGLGYRLGNEDYLIAAYERTRYDVAGASDDHKGQMALQVKF